MLGRKQIITTVVKTLPMQVLSISPKRRNKLVLGFVGVDNYT
jgi:hypothetical protein